MSVTEDVMRDSGDFSTKRKFAEKTKKKTGKQWTKEEHKKQYSESKQTCSLNAHNE